MTDDDLATMNKALEGAVWPAKDKTYRPYCGAPHCVTMPRMMLKTYGFQCPACRNRIGFDLMRIST